MEKELLIVNFTIAIYDSKKHFFPLVRPLIIIISGIKFTSACH